MEQLFRERTPVLKTLKLLTPGGLPRCPQPFLAMAHSTTLHGVCGRARFVAMVGAELMGILGWAVEKCRVDGCGWRAGGSVRPPNCACPLSGRGRGEREHRFRLSRTLGQRGAVLAILRVGANAPAKPYPVLPRHATGCRARPKTNHWRHGEAFAPSFTLALTAVAVVVTHQLTAIATS